MDRIAPRRAIAAQPCLMGPLNDPHPPAAGQIEPLRAWRWPACPRLAAVFRRHWRVGLHGRRSQTLRRMKHFSVDGTLLEAWASMKSFRPKGGDGPPPGDGGRNRAVDFRGERRLNETHESRTDPGARLARRGPGKEARLCYEGHVLTDIPHIGSLQAQGAAQTRWEQHSQVLQGHSIASLSDKRCVCSRRAPFLSVFIVLVALASGVEPY